MYESFIYKTHNQFKMKIHELRIITINMFKPETHTPVHKYTASKLSDFFRHKSRYLGENRQNMVSSRSWSLSIIKES